MKRWRQDLSEICFVPGVRNRLTFQRMRPWKVSTEASQIAKTVRVVSTIDYYLK